jgi:serine/threonine protein kinase
METSSYAEIVDIRYRLLEEIDSKNLYALHKCENITEEEYRTIKIFKDHTHPIIQKEININEIIRQSNNPHFIKMINSSTWYFDENGTIRISKYIVYEYCPFPSLLQYIKCASCGFCEKVCGYIFVNFSKEVRFLHNMGICLGNIKLNNIFIDPDTLNIKIQDFSQSSIFRNSNGEKILLKKLVRTSDKNKFKEVLYDGEKEDILCLAQLLFTLRTGKDGYFSKHKNLLNLLKSKKFESFWNSIGIEDLSPEFKDFFISMMAFNYQERPTFEELFNKDWVKKITNLNENQKKAYEEEVRNELKKRLK